MVEKRWFTNSWYLLITSVTRSGDLLNFRPKHITDMDWKQVVFRGKAAGARSSSRFEGRLLLLSFELDLRKKCPSDQSVPDTHSTPSLRQRSLRLRPRFPAADTMSEKL